MADESFQEKTEAPTPRKREETRRKGQVPRSTEVTTAILLLCAAGVVQLAAGPMVSSLASLLGHSTRIGAAMPVGVEGVTGWLRATGWQFLGVLVVPVATLAATAALSGAVQARGVLSLQPLQPDWARLSPQQNLKKILGVRSLAELAKSLLKLVIVGGAVFLALSHAWPDLVTLPQQAPLALAGVLRRYAVRLLLTAGIAYLVLAAADYLFQFWQFEKNLRMSREELKRDQKESEGDAMVRARLRSMGRSLARRQMMKDVPNADVVITNPTRIAVALKYDPNKAPAPVIVAMGQRKIAQRIRELALESGVPLVENKPLARALLGSGRVGQPIPAELYVAVAEVLAFVMRRRGLGVRPLRPGRS